jgi:membrane-associated phospholipid phosphatase
MRALGAALLLLLAAGSVPCAADEVGAAAPAETPSPPSDPAHPPPLTVDLTAHTIATGGMLLVSGFSQLEASMLAPPSCRSCEPTRFDRWARHELRWTDVKAAGLASDVLVVAIPAGAALTLGLAARAEGASGREVEENLLVVTEAASAAVLLTQTAKFATARVRPDAWAGNGYVTADGRMSFWGGHSAFAFSVAAGATQVARLRGRPGWKWLALASFAGAAATGWLRVAADRHWTTDVLAGAAVGTATGLAVPLLVMRPAGERGSAVTLVPAPGGLALVF